MGIIQGLATYMEQKNGIAIAAFVVSFLSFCISSGFALINYNYTKSSKISDRISVYLQEYKSLAELLSKDENGKELPIFSLSLKTYVSSSHYRQRRMEILFGLLVNVVDAMNEAGDKRSDVWASYLGGIQGPLIISDHRTWSSNEKTLRQMEIARRKAKSVA